MDFKLQFGNAMNPKEITASKSDTIRGLMKSHRISFSEGSVTWNGTILSQKQMDMTLEALGVSDDDYITTSSKVNGAK